MGGRPVDGDDVEQCLYRSRNHLPPGPGAGRHMDALSLQPGDGPGDSRPLVVGSSGSCLQSDWPSWRGRCPSQTAQPCLAGPRGRWPLGLAAGACSVLTASTRDGVLSAGAGVPTGAPVRPAEGSSVQRCRMCERPFLSRRRSGCGLAGRSRCGSSGCCWAHAASTVAGETRFRTRDLAWGPAVLCRHDNGISHFPSIPEDRGMDAPRTWSAASVHGCRSLAGLCACFSTHRAPPPPPPVPHLLHLPRAIILYTELPLPALALPRPPRGTRAQTRRGESRGEGGEHRRKRSPVTRNLAGCSLASRGSIANRRYCKS